MGFTAVHLWKHPEKSCKFNGLLTAASYIFVFPIDYLPTVGLALPYLLGYDLCDTVLTIERFRITLQQTAIVICII